MIYLPLKTVSTLNQREHYMARARRAKKERALGYIVTPPALKAPLTITLRRTHPKRYKPLDDDNLRACFKGLRDGIADKIGVDDGSPLLTWVYEQVAGTEFGVTLEFKPSEPAQLRPESMPLSVGESESG